MQADACIAVITFDWVTEFACEFITADIALKCHYLSFTLSNNSASSVFKFYNFVIFSTNTSISFSVGISLRDGDLGGVGQDIFRFRRR